MISLRGYYGVGLCLPRDPKNVACVLRACGCFGAAFCAYSGERYKRHVADTQRAYRHMPLFCAGDDPEDILNVLPYECVPVAVELVEGAIPLASYVHPERAYYIFGPEDGSIPFRVLEKCRDKVIIPSDFCLNLASAAAVVLYDRTAKRAPNRTPYADGKPVT